jgi:hypothetical protein
MYGPYPIRAPKHTGKTSEATPLLPKTSTPSDKLQALGIPQSHAQELLDEIAANNDQPYHAGRLWNGNAYLITQNDTVYYGRSAHLEKLTDVMASRTKCIDHQVRRFQTADGLSIAVSNQRGRQWAAADTRLLCFTIPLPHSAQAAFRKPPTRSTDVANSTSTRTLESS